MRTYVPKAVFALIGALAATLASACVDEETPVAPGARGNLALTTAPLESLGEDPPFIEIAGQVPSFGGFWFNEQGTQIVVGLTDPGDFARVVGMIPQYLGAHKPSAGYIAVSVTRTFADLARYRAALRGEVLGLAGVATLGVKESANRVEVGITNAAVEPQVRELVRRLGIPDDAVAILNVPVPRVMSHTLLDQHPAALIEGGWMIGPSGCTLGFPAFRTDGASVFVMNSHCTPTSPGFDGGAITQGGVHIGTEILDPPGWVCAGGFSTCRHADAALISADRPMAFGKIARTTERTTADQSGGPLTIDHGNPTFTITGRSNDVFENEPLDKVGVRTGWSHGNVEDTCTDVFFDEDRWSRLCSDRVDFAVDRGDSGSPVFSVKADGTVDLRGIVFGRWSNGLGDIDGFMSDLRQIERDVGPLSVHAVIATIFGYNWVPANSTQTWTAVVSGGKAPFTFAWYRDGVLVSSSSSYTGNTGTSHFQLRLDVSDARGDTSSDVHAVFIGSAPCPGGC